MTASNKRQSIRNIALLSFFLGLPALFNAAQANPQAVIADTAEGGGMQGATFFMAIEVNGVETATTALSASKSASYGRGPHMVTRTAERPVSAGTTRLKLQGKHAHAAPIQTIFKDIFSDGEPEVTGTVTVELSPAERYRVNGLIDSFVREVWLEDSQGKQVAGSKVTAQTNPELLKQMEGASYVATNLHYESDWISEVPGLHLPFIPAGSRLKLVDWGSNRAKILVDGRKMRIGVDMSRDSETIQQLVARVTSAEDPRLKIATYPDNIRNAILAGRVLLGMTREQALVALGRPRVDFTPKLDATEWKYEMPEQGDVYLVFDEAGLLKTIDASRAARKLVTYEQQP